MTTPCTACNGSGDDRAHPWSEGDIEASRIPNLYAACERCEGTGVEPTPEDLKLRALWAENDARLGEAS